MNLKLTIYIGSSNSAPRTAEAALAAFFHPDGSVQVLLQSGELPEDIF